MAKHLTVTLLDSASGAHRSMPCKPKATTGEMHNGLASCATLCFTVSSGLQATVLNRSDRCLILLHHTTGPNSLD